MFLTWDVERVSKFIKSVKDGLNSDKEALRIFELQKEIRNKANELKKK